MPGGVVLAAEDDEVVALLGLEVFDHDLLNEHSYVPMDLVDFTKGQGMILTSTIRRLRILLHQDQGSFLAPGEVSWTRPGARQRERPRH